MNVQASHTPEGCLQHRNLIIEGDNFDSLRLLRATHAGKIRVIYIDPPYNTGNKDWVYNDKFVGANDRWRHSQWLEFLYQRLTLARELLTGDGVMLVSINDENRSRLELLMDEVFPGRKLGSFVWKTRSGSNDEQALFSVDHEYVLVYGQAGFKFRGEDKDFAQYKNPDNDPRGRWKTGDLGKGHTRLERPNAYYPIQNPKTGVWYPKPLSLIKGLLSQATQPGDIVLDFFAGSGTTGQAVLELNAEDSGQRRFILCSSTEATAKEPDKNLCRDVCAERLRRAPAPGDHRLRRQTRLQRSPGRRICLFAA